MSADNSARNSKSSPATVAVHGGERSEEQQFGAVVSPVFHSATFAFKNFDEMRRYARGELPDAYFYSRYANPTVAEAERKIAELEGAEACVVTSSGSAATFCTMATLCSSGDEVIACDSVYGGTVKILTKLFNRFDVKGKFVTVDEVASLRDLATENSRLFWLESPANPLNRIVDLKTAAEVS